MSWSGYVNIICPTGELGGRVYSILEDKGFDPCDWDESNPSVGIFFCLDDQEFGNYSESTPAEVVTLCRNETPDEPRVTARVFLDNWQAMLAGEWDWFQ